MGKKINGAGNSLADVQNDGIAEEDRISLEFQDDAQDDAQDDYEGQVDEAEKSIELLTFFLEHEEYGINVMDLKEVIRPVEITYVPRAPGYIEGIISLRGVVIPIFKLKKMLGLHDTVTDTDFRYLIVSTEKGLVGILADIVNEVISIEERRIEAPPLIKNMSIDLLAGVGRHDTRMIIILNTPKLVEGITGKILT